MTRTIGCLHAHHSNIGYVEHALRPDGWELVHHVDPGLLRRISQDPGFGEAQARSRAAEQVQWIASSNVDAILITCTNYIALLDEARLDIDVPVIKLDESFFSHVCSIRGPQLVLFTNPATVEGTMRRLEAFASEHGVPLDVESRVIEDAFKLVMRGDSEAYKREVSCHIRHALTADPGNRVSVAQLSMVEAAEAVERELGVSIGNPLEPLAQAVRAALGTQ